MFSFWFVFGCLPFAIPVPEIRGEVPENFEAPEFLDPLSKARARQAADLASSQNLRPATKNDTAPEVAGRRVSNV